ncbi:MAG: 30S ribosome-binding factor RbfA [Clostridia bacterium]|nr:30S ribosome-binding factor RbfA [Clostridia bacterium]
MPNIDRVNSELAKQIGLIIDRKIKDPRVQGMLTVTAVRTTPDLKYAKVYVSYYGDEDKRDQTFSALNNCAGFVRNELKSVVKLRLIPTLTFIYDDTALYAAEMSKLIDKAKSTMVYFEDDEQTDPQ